MFCLIIVKDNAHADLPVRGLVIGWLWRVVQTKPILLSSHFCSRPAWKGADKRMGGGVETGWRKEKKVNRRRRRDWRGVDKWEPAALASGEEE